MFAGKGGSKRGGGAVYHPESYIKGPTPSRISPTQSRISSNIQRILKTREARNLEVGPAAHPPVEVVCESLLHAGLSFLSIQIRQSCTNPNQSTFDVVHVCVMPWSECSFGFRFRDFGFGFRFRFSGSGFGFGFRWFRGRGFGFVVSGSGLAWAWPCTTEFALHDFLHGKVSSPLICTRAWPCTRQNVVYKSLSFYGLRLHG